MRYAACRCAAIPGGPLRTAAELFTRNPVCPADPNAGLRLTGPHYSSVYPNHQALRAASDSLRGGLHGKDADTSAHARRHARTASAGGHAGAAAGHGAGGHVSAGGHMATGVATGDAVTADGHVATGAAAGGHGATGAAAAGDADAAERHSAAGEYVRTATATTADDADDGGRHTAVADALGALAQGRDDAGSWHLDKLQVAQADGTDAERRAAAAGGAALIEQHRAAVGDAVVADWTEQAGQRVDDDGGVQEQRRLHQSSQPAPAGIAQDFVQDGDAETGGGTRLRRRRRLQQLSVEHGRAQAQVCNTICCRLRCRRCRNAVHLLTRCHCCLMCNLHFQMWSRIHRHADVPEEAVCVQAMLQRARRIQREQRINLRTTGWLGGFDPMLATCPLVVRLRVSAVLSDAASARLQWLSSSLVLFPAHCLLRKRCEQPQEHCVAQQLVLSSVQSTLCVFVMQARKVAPEAVSEFAAAAWRCDGLGFAWECLAPEQDDLAHLWQD